MSTHGVMVDSGSLVACCLADAIPQSQSLSKSDATVRCVNGKPIGHNGFNKNVLLKDASGYERRRAFQVTD